MKVKKKQKHLEEADDNNSNSGVGGFGVEDMDNKEPPDDLGFPTVLNFLRGYLGMLSSMNCDQPRELIDQGTH